MSNKVFICSPYDGDASGNTIKARKYCRRALEFGFNPVAPHLYYPQFLNDNQPKERVRSRVLQFEAMMDCVQVWVFGEPTDEMRKEIEFAKENNIPVFYKTLENG